MVQRTLRVMSVLDVHSFQRRPIHYEMVILFHWTCMVLFLHNVTIGCFAMSAQYDC